jgi:hypothetical protein
VTANSLPQCLQFRVFATTHAALFEHDAEQNFRVRRWA